MVAEKPQVDKGKGQAGKVLPTERKRQEVSKAKKKKPSQEKKIWKTRLRT